jgi:menaquinone-dependent protoporphyrinogen oxidase
MNAKVLVAYASKYGSTREIAEKIGVVLRDAGFAVDVLPAERAADVASYRAVVLGSAVYIGGWRKSAARFLKANERALSGRPVWLFSSGPTGRGDPVELVKGWRFPQALQPVADRVAPVDIALFQGAVDTQNLGFFGRLAIKNVKAPVGDFRDWNAITVWAGSIAAKLKKNGAAAR